MLHLLYARAFRVSLSQRKGNGLLGRGVGAVVASSIPPRWFHATRNAYKKQPPLKTLSPERLVDIGQGIFDFSGNLKANRCLYYTHRLLFPPGTKGVLYYYQPPLLPPIAGELRFRICDDPSQFASGRDLEAGAGKHWSIPLINIVRGRSYRAIRRHLLEEGLIDHKLVADIENMNATNIGRGGIKKVVELYDLDQPFSMNLGRDRIRLRLTTRSASRDISISPFSLRGRQIRVRFELHTPKRADTEKRMLRLRVLVLEILTPVTHNTLPDAYHLGTKIIEPVPGDFASRKKNDRPSIEPWIFVARGAEKEKIINFLTERALEKEKYGV